MPIPSGESIDVLSKYRSLRGADCHVVTPRFAFVFPAKNLLRGRGHLFAQQRQGSLRDLHEELVARFAAAAAAARPLLLGHAEERADAVAIVVLEAELVARGGEGGVHGGPVGAFGHEGSTR